MAKLIKKDPIHIELKDLRKGFTVEPEYSYTFVLKKHEVQIDIIEAEDVLFRTDSALFLPFALPKEDEKEDDSVFESQDDPMDKQIRVSGLSVIGGIFRYYQLCLDRGQAKHILITGHTDTAGKESHNEKLSLKRANVVSYIILGDKKSRSMFVINVNKQHTNEDKQHVLLWLAKVLGVPEAHPGKIDGKMGRNTNSAIRAIKKYLRSDNFPPCNYKEATFGDDIDDIRATLQNNTNFDVNLWAVVFEIYQAELQVSLKQDKLDIFDIRESLKWVDNEKMAVGCGETWPIDARGKKNYRSESNRRVEILFYDPDEIKDEIPCKEDKCVEDDCHIFKNMDRYNPKPIEKHLKWEYINIEEDGRILGNYHLVTDLLKEDEPKEIFHLASNKKYRCSKKGADGTVDEYGYLTIPFKGIPIFDCVDLQVEEPDGTLHTVFSNIPYLSLSLLSDNCEEDQIEPTPIGDAQEKGAS